MENRNDIKQRTYRVSEKAFFFLKQASVVQSLDKNDLLTRAIQHVDKALARFELLTPPGLRRSKGRGKLEGRVQIGTNFAFVYHKRIEALAACRNVWPGDVLTACILLYLDGDLRQASSDDQLRDMPGFPLAGAFPYRPSGDFLWQPSDDEGPSAAPERKLMLMRNSGRILLDSSVLCGTFLTKSDGNPFSKEARKAVYNCLNRTLFGVTTTFDICEFGNLLLEREFANIWDENPSAFNGKPYPVRAPHAAVTKLLQLLANSSITIISIEPVDLFAAHEFELPRPLAARVKLAACRRIWPNESVAVLTLAGYEHGPDWIRGVKFTDF